MRGQPLHPLEMVEPRLLQDPREADQLDLGRGARPVVEGHGDDVALPRVPGVSHFDPGFGSSHLAPLRGEPGPAASVNPTKYIQHNLAVADGLAGFGALLQQLPPGSARVSVARVFQDGDFVFAHTDYDFFGPKVGFDVFRFEAGKIVEHWDTIEPIPGREAWRNPNGKF